MFESDRQLAKIGKPVDRGEWGMTPPTVNAYYNPQMNDINFPAGVLQPPLYDPKMDDAPNYGNTGSTIGHELTHGFDDEGRQFDAQGQSERLVDQGRTRSDFTKRAQCIVDQYGAIHGRRRHQDQQQADPGRRRCRPRRHHPRVRGVESCDEESAAHDIDGFTPDQRFFIGLAQWACENQRPRELRVCTRSPIRIRPGSTGSTAWW